MNKILSFLKENGHRIFTFIVGLAFISAVFFVVGFTAVKIYRIFVPDNIYTDEVFEKNLYGGSVYEVLNTEIPEDAGDDFFETYFESEEFFEDYIQTFIGQDMPDFDDPTQLNDEYMISFGLWQAIKLNNTQNVYKTDSNNKIRVPKKDVETFVEYCFDFTRKIDHRSVDISGEFNYNMLNGTYKIGASGIEKYLVPDIIKVEKQENDIYLLTVDCYIAGDIMSSENLTNDPVNFHKRVEVTLQDMGIQHYTSYGNPVPRYMILSMDTVDKTEEAQKEDQNDQGGKKEVDLN